MSPENSHLKSKLLFSVWDLTDFTFTNENHGEGTYSCYNAPGSEKCINPRDTIATKVGRFAVDWIKVKHIQTLEIAENFC